MLRLAATAIVALAAMAARAVAVLALSTVAAHAADRMEWLATRPGVKVGTWVMPRDAPVTLLLFTGGEGGIGSRNGGEPTSANFLVRSRDRLAAAGFNVAIIGRPSDVQDMDLVFRASERHIEDVRAVVEMLKRELGKPVWLVGTSRGTTSAAAAGIALGDAIAGVVLTSSITDGSMPGAVQNMPLDRLAVPVLVVHHRQDACRSTSPMFAPRIIEGLTHSRAKKLVIMEGGSGTSGPPCEPMHYHGFVGIEQQAVDAIAAFVHKPAS